MEYFAATILWRVYAPNVCHPKAKRSIPSKNTTSDVGVTRAARYGSPWASAREPDVALDIDAVLQGFPVGLMALRAGREDAFRELRELYKAIALLLAHHGSLKDHKRAVGFNQRRASRSESARRSFIDRAEQLFGFVEISRQE
jgi:hypothetical protein